MLDKDFEAQILEHRFLKDYTDYTDYLSQILERFHGIKWIFGAQILEHRFLKDYTDYTDFELVFICSLVALFSSLCTL